MTDESQRQVWMVAGVSSERSHETPTFGPFTSRQEAEQFASQQDAYYVYDAVANRKSPCGPWLP